MVVKTAESHGAATSAIQFGAIPHGIGVAIRPDSKGAFGTRSNLK